MPRNNKVRGLSSGSGGTQPDYEGYPRLVFDDHDAPYFGLACDPEALFQNWDAADLQQLRGEMIEMRSRTLDLLRMLDSHGAAPGPQGMALRTRSSSPALGTYGAGWGSGDTAPAQGQQSQQAKAQHGAGSWSSNTKLKRQRPDDTGHETKRGVKQSRSRSTYEDDLTYYDEDQQESRHSSHRSHSSGNSGYEPPASDDFWTHMETYLRPMVEDDLQYVMPVNNETLTSVLTIPPLGGTASPPPSSTAPPGDGAATGNNKNETTATADGTLPSAGGATDGAGLHIGVLSQRLMAALVSCPQVATVQIDTKSQFPIALPPAEHDTMFEEALHKVLVAHGLLDGDTSMVCLSTVIQICLSPFCAPFFSPIHCRQQVQNGLVNEDDEVCAQLRKLFKEYKDLHMRLNTQRRALYSKAQRCVEEGTTRKHMLEEARQDIDAFKRYASHHGRRK